MKKIIALLTLFVFINACDDGNLEVKNIDFENVNAQKCSSKDVIYKVKDSEILYIEIPSTTFLNDETIENSPITLPISSTVKVTYRQYSGSVTQANVCPTVPSATPNVTEEWIATAGTIQITSTAIKTTNTTTNATKITGYKHYIVFKNITFQKPNGNQTYETYVFGNYTTSVSALAFGFNDQANKSTCDNKVFNFNGSEALTFNSSNFATLFDNSVTTIPRTALISTENKLSYRLYNNVISNAYFCTTPPPATPLLLQEWNAVDGVLNTNGIIEVTTTTFGTGFQHTIRLKKVTLKKGNSTFTLGDDYLFGSFITNP
jgi:hypothetical protein